MDMLKPARWVRSDQSHVPGVLEQMKIMRANDHGIIGMKIYEEGDFTNLEDREKSMQYVWQSGLVDAITIGFKSVEEIDEAMLSTNQGLSEMV